MNDILTTDTPTLEKIRQFQVAMMLLGTPDGTVPLNEPLHHFSKGVYARELRMDPGSYAVGKLHSTEHLLIVMGDATIIQNDKRTHFQGFHVVNSLPGAKRVVVAHDFTVFVTIHLTTETDPEVIESLIITPEPEIELMLAEQRQFLENQGDTK